MPQKIIYAKRSGVLLHPSASPLGMARPYRWEFAFQVNSGWVRWGYTFTAVDSGTQVTES